MKLTLLLIAALGTAGLAAPAGEFGPSSSVSTAAPAAPRTYSARGVIRELESDGRTIKIRHDEIPGYMPAMTMPFAVRDTNELVGLTPGDTVSFRLNVTTEDGWIDQLKKLGVAERTGAPTTGPVRLVRDVEPLKIGDPLPDYALTNELGQPVSLSQFRGQALAITFLFTRCPYPTFCPRMANNFEQAQQRLLADAHVPTNWHLLTVSFDPEHDTPAVLKAYAEAHHYDPQRWTFATGSLLEITALTEQFGMYFWHDETGGITHNLRTVVVDARGRVQKIFTDNTWTPEELATELAKGAKAKP